MQLRKLMTRECRLIGWCLLVWLVAFDAWAARAVPPMVSSPRVVRELAPGHPLYKGVQLCKKAQWAQAKVFFLQIKRDKLLSLKRADRPLLYLYLGLSYIHLLQRKEGMRAFESALLLDECTALPAFLDLSPQLKKRFASFQRRFAALCERKKLKRLREALLKKVRKRQKPDKRKKPALDVLKQRQSRGIRLAGWLSAGAGAVALASAFVAGGLSLSAEVSRNESPATREGTFQYIRLHKLATQRALVANVLFVSAGVLIFTGFALQLSQLIQPLLPPEPGQTSVPNSSTPRLIPGAVPLVIR